jgi:hypothetical protein
MEYLDGLAVAMVWGLWFRVQFLEGIETTLDISFSCVASAYTIKKWVGNKAQFHNSSMK